MVYRMILWLQGRLIKRLQRKFMKRTNSTAVITSQKDYEFNIYQLISLRTTAIEQLLGHFLNSDAYQISITQ